MIQGRLHLKLLLHNPVWVRWNGALLLIHFHLLIKFRHYLIGVSEGQALALRKWLEQSFNKGILLGFHHRVIRFLLVRKGEHITATTLPRA